MRKRYLAQARLFQLFVQDPDGLWVELNFEGIASEPAWGGDSENYADMPRAGQAAPDRRAGVVGGNDDHAVGRQCADHAAVLQRDLFQAMQKLQLDEAKREYATALERYLTEAPRDFLCVATPGAGKTTFALRIARELMAARIIRRIVVVAPTEHLKTQWADAAARVGTNNYDIVSRILARVPRIYVGNA